MIRWTNLKMILIMNVTGIVLWLFYFLVKRFFKERLARKYLYLLLKFNLLAFLVPLGFVGEVYRGIWLDIRLLLGKHSTETIQVTPKSQLLLQVEKKIELSLGMKGTFLLFALYLGVVAGLLVRQILKYRKKNQQVRWAIRANAGKRDACLEELRQELKIRRRVDVCYCDGRGMISTVGIFHPIIFLQDPGNDTDKRILLRHELCHIKRYDVLWELLAHLAGAIYFYHPVVRKLLLELDRLREHSCDECAIAALDSMTRARYAQVLVDYSMAQNQAMVGFLGNKTQENARDELEKRVDLIVEYEAYGKMCKNTAIILIISILFLSSFTSLAYDEVSWWSGEANRVKMSETQENVIGVMEEGYVFTGIQESVIDKYELLYDIEYVDTTGNIYPLESEMEGDKCLLHDYDEVIVIEHLHYINGDCEISYCKADRCNRCKYTLKKELLHVTYFQTCPH